MQSKMGADNLFHTATYRNARVVTKNVRSFPQVQTRGNSEIKNSQIAPAGNQTQDIQLKTTALTAAPGSCVQSPDSLNGCQPPIGVGTARTRREERHTLNGGILMWLNPIYSHETIFTHVSDWSSCSGVERPSGIRIQLSPTLLYYYVLRVQQWTVKGDKRLRPQEVSLHRSSLCRTEVYLFLFFFGWTLADNHLRGCYGVTGGVGRARELAMKRAPGLDDIGGT
ncbi:jg1683 [Pararge aegeria aegeria]|uniref:Jg1683 protein n=1 Tax=Pararge aegeria aegeria TaxID=348720 RepID=A0A8S4RCM3_9NEOP|nr:jg1683 [Pararge aegeria aegeria]